MSDVALDTRAFLDDLVADLRRNWGGRLVSVVLHGSRARGDHRPDSDVDFLVVSEAFPASRRGRHDVFAAAAQRTLERFRGAEYGQPVELSPVYKTPDEAAYHSPLFLDMTLEAVILHDREGFFGRVLDAMRARMKELGSRRVVLPGGAAYWDLKPDYKFGESIEI